MTPVAQIAGGILLAAIVIAGVFAVLRNSRSLGALFALALIVAIVLAVAGGS